MIKALRVIVKIGIVAGLILPFAYTPATTFPFVFGKAIYFSILVEILAALYLALAVISPEDRPRRSPILIAIGAYLAALLLATAFGFDPHRSFWGNHERMSGAFTLVHFLIYFLIARSTLRTKRQWSWVFGAFLLSSVAMCVIAVVEHFYPVANPGDLGIFANAPAGRVWATLGNYIYLGVFTLFGVFVSAYLLTEIKSWAVRALLVLVGLLNFYVLFLTESRAALAAVIFAIPLVGFIYAWRRGGAARQAALAGATLLVLLTAGAFLARNTAFVHAIPGVRRIVTTSLTGSGNRTRVLAWEVALDAWKNKPIFGWGPENFYAAFNVYYRPESLVYTYYETWFDRAHNSLLDTMAMTGTLGLLALFGVYGAAIWTILRRIRAGFFTPIQGALFILLLGAYFAQNLFAFDALSGFLLFYLLLAFLDAEIVPRVGVARQIPTALVATILVPAVVVAGWLVFLNVRMYQANARNLYSISALRSGSYTDAIRIHAEAIGLGSPHNPELRSDFAREAGQLVGAGIPPEKQKDALAALEVGVEDLRTNVGEAKDVFDYIMLAQILMASNNPTFIAEAESVLKEAIPLSPRRQQLLFSLARAYTLEKKSSDAASLMKQVVADEPRVGESHWIYAITLLDSGDEKGAWQETQEAIRRGYAWRSQAELQAVLGLGKKFGAPADPSVLASYAEIEAASGATSTAREDMKKAVAADPALAPRADALYAKIGAGK